MHISMIGPVYPYRGGIAHYTSALASALEAAGHSVQLISFKRQYPSALYPGKTDKDPSTEAHWVNAEYLLDPIYPWTWRSASKAILATKPSVVLIQWWSTFWAPAYAAVAGSMRRHVPVAFVIHNVFPHEPKPWDHWLAHLALAQGQAFLVQAPHERDKLTQLIPRADMRLCGMPPFPRFGQHFISQHAARDRLGLPPHVPVLLFFGLVRPYKGLAHLIEAVARVTKPVHLVVAGEFWEDVSVYRRQIERLGLSARITVLDRYVPNEEAHLLFSAADTLVAPYVGGTQSAAVGVARGYGLPLIVTERVAAGIDPATTDVRVVPAGNLTELAAAISHVAIHVRPPHFVQPSHDDWTDQVRAIEGLAH